MIPCPSTARWVSDFPAIVDNHFLVKIIMKFEPIDMKISPLASILTGLV
jgi:hypothetical protein